MSASPGPRSVEPPARVPDGTRVGDYDYDLPEGRIADHPSPVRDESRLLVVDRSRAPVEERHGADAGFRHLRFSDLPHLFRSGDVLVVNESRVIPARLRGRKPSGARAEILLLQPWRPPGSEGREGQPPDGAAGRDDGLWEALVRPGSKLKPGRRVVVGDELEIEIVEGLPGGTRLVRLDTVLPWEEALDRYGEVPLPPYIQRAVEEEDRERYQTVYARVPGSVAAPTAGLHFTEGLLSELAALGVTRAPVTLHVGMGTFRPVEVEDPAEHVMHRESYDVPVETARAVQRARARGGRVWAVGTTAMRTLEAAAQPDGSLRSGPGSTDLFIRPPYDFRVVEGLVTNFHLPRSTLLMLVAALAGYPRTMSAYREAVARDYRFYSYGDAMVIPPVKD
ncbi:MAG: tRNA preQ1(34) S-adenosylmethionine ribosyltransferase-isomerase QueA [Gemmatimonadota bacterium]